MIKSLTRPWKQIVGYFFSKGPVSSSKLKDILIHTIDKVRDAGFIPKSIICDQGTNNIGMKNQLNVTDTQPFINYNGENIYFFHDSPHLIESPFSPMRVCLATQTLSHSVSSGMMTLISLNQMKTSAIYTAKFVEFFDKLFDVFNSITHRDPKTALKMCFLL
uniref:Transposable element P transposase n=1 Tax=Schizaphis graminum TaxID=13262 RepID=A0A2S2PJN9_SCHGA